MQLMCGVRITCTVVTSACPCAGQLKGDFRDPSCRNVGHGCIRQAPLYRLEMEPHGNIVEEGGLMPKAQTG